ncbi:uncharacterized protein LOC135378395 isoform X2 [Ornithodoros turicata]|uniref:uncharacterized protein LOC135378395 isoform X2 n=1 Tax=Ornithodoros turicata TaxID=34597 RepID=UPI003138DE56
MQIKGTQHWLPAFEISLIWMFPSWQPAEDAVRDNHWPIQLPGASTKVTTSTQTYSACSNRSCQAMPDYRTRGTLAFPDRRSMGTQSFIDSRNKGCQAFMHDAQDTKDQTPKRRRQRPSSVGCQADIKPNDHKSTQTDSKDIFTGPQSEAVMHSSGDPSRGPSVSSEQHGTVRSSISDDGEVTASCQGTQYAVISSSAQETSQSATGKTLAEETNYVVSRTQLLEALQFCRDCGTTECQVQLSTMGTLVHAVITCKRSHARTWHSQHSHCNK